MGQRGAHLASGERKELGNIEPDANDKAGYYMQHKVAPLLGQGQGHHHEHPDVERFRKKNVHPGFFGIHLSKVMKRAM